MVRFGIAGFGLHAVKRLMPGFRRAQRSTVVALSRRDAEKARASAREYGIPHAFASIADLCRCAEVDAVFVATPNASHLPDVLTAVRCRKPVLVEKPMGLNADECRQMIEASARANVALGVAQIFRFCESTNRVRQRIAAGDIGRVAMARAEFAYPGRGHARTWINDAAIAGGGPIADVGVHCIDALRFMLGDEVVSIGARGHGDEDSRQLEASAALALEFRGGAVGAVLVSMRAAYQTPFEIVGEAGVLRADDGLSVEQPVTIELRRDGKVVEREQVSNEAAYARQVDAFADTVEHGTPFPVPGEEGWRNQVILDAAYRSLRNGQIESVAFD